MPGGDVGLPLVRCCSLFLGEAVTVPPPCGRRLREAVAACPTLVRRPTLVPSLPIIVYRSNCTTLKLHYDSNSKLRYDSNCTTTTHNRHTRLSHHPALTPGSHISASGSAFATATPPTTTATPPTATATATTATSPNHTWSAGLSKLTYARAGG